MATEYKIIKIRRGTRATFIPSTLLPGELWMSTDTGEAFFCYSAGNYKQFSTFEDMVEFVKGVNEEIILELTEGINTATDNAEQATIYANEAGDYANTKGDYAYQKGQEAQAIVDSAAPIINTNLQATYADKATQTGEYLHVEVADDALVQITELKGKSTQVVTETSPSPDNPSPILSVGDSDFEVVSCGKNLFDGELEQGNISTVAPGDSLPSVIYMRSKNYIKVNPNSVYSMDRQGQIVGLRFYDGSKSFLGPFAFATGSNFTTPDNCEYMRFVITTTVDLSMKFQIELGSTATDYEPYKEDRITIDTTNQKFRGLPNGVSDGFGFNEDGEFGYWKRAGLAVFDGSADESWGLSGASTDTIKRYVITVSSTISSLNNTNLICTSFKPSSALTHGTVYHYNTHTIGLSVNATLAPDVPSFKTWLQSNPVTLLYELETPIFTPMPEIYLKSYKGVTNVFTTAEVQPELTGTFKSELWANEYKTEKNIGLLENLDTANKNNLVGAINETREIAVNASYNVSEQFDAAKTYAVGDYMIRNNTLFRCTVEIPVAKPFDFNDWEATTVGKEMTTSNDNLANIVNSSSNENGEWVKFADGTMICTHSGTTSLFPITDAYGSLFQGTKLWTFPVSFAEPPIAISGMISATNGAGWGTIVNTTATTATLRAYDIISRPNGTEIRLKLMAIGRWK